MTAKYNVIARGNPSNPAAPKKHYASFISSGKMTLRQLAKQIASISTVSSIDTLAVLEAFLQVIPQQLAEGNIVSLGEFGSFRLKVKSAGSETPEAVSAHNITNVLPQFTPAKAFKQVIAATEFEKA